MSRLLIFGCGCCLLFLLVSSLTGTNRKAAPARPNVVFIMADDLGWRDLGCYGNSFHETPNLDRLAAQSVRFTQAYAAAPVCSPTRAALMTGKHPARRGLTDFIPGRNARTDLVLNDPLNTPAIPKALPLSETTLAELFRAQGYATAIVGKWHLGETTDFYPDKQGFEQTVAVAPSGGPPGYFYPYKTYFTLEDLKANGQPGEYLTDRLGDEAVRLIKGLKDRPFFLYLSQYAPHIPIQPKPDLLAKYERKKQSLGSDTFANPHYAAMVESLDASVGRVLEALQANGLLENTIIVFTSDNGGLSVPEGKFTPATTNLPLRDGKGYLSEGGLRVPLLIRWPGMGADGRAVPTPVVTTDFFATFSEMLTGKPADTDGEALQPILQGKKRRKPALFWHYPHYSNQGGRPSSAIRAGDYKLIVDEETAQARLYNLGQDPGETRDLAGQETAKTRALRKQLNDWLATVGATRPTQNPNFRKPN